MPATANDIAVWRSQFDKLGVEVVRLQLANGRYQGNPDLLNQAVAWLAQREKENQSRAESSRAEEIALARSARDAALEANTFAASANEIAREANEIARDASASAARSADAARTNNIIATLALIAAAIAIAISIIGVFIKR
jgi:hypothetical protein